MNRHVRVHADLSRIQRLSRELASVADHVEVLEQTYAWQHRTAKRTIRESARDSLHDLDVLRVRLERIASLDDRSLTSEKGQTNVEYAVFAGMAVLAVPLMLFLMAGVLALFAREARTVDTPPSTTPTVAPPSAPVPLPVQPPYVCDPATDATGCVGGRMMGIEQYTAEQLEWFDAHGWPAGWDPWGEGAP